LDLRTTLLLDDSADVELLCQFFSGPALESQLFAVSASLKAIAEDVGEWIWGFNILSLIEFPDHFLLDFASCLAFRDVIWQLIGWRSLPVHEHDNLGGRVERDKESNNFGSHPGKSGLQTTTVANKVKERVSASRYNDLIRVQLHLEFCDCPIIRGIRFCGAKAGRVNRYIPQFVRGAIRTNLDNSEKVSYLGELDFRVDDLGLAFINLNACHF